MHPVRKGAPAGRPADSRRHLRRALLFRVIRINVDLGDTDKVSVGDFQPGVGSLVATGTEASQALILCVDLVNAELCARNPVRDQSFLEGLGSRMAALLEEEFGTAGILRGN